MTESISTTIGREGSAPLTQGVKAHEITEEDHMPAPPRHAVSGVVLPYVLLITGLALSVLLMGSMTSRALGTPTPAGTPGSDAVAYDFMVPATNEGRAQFGNMFIGEVVAIAGEDRIPTSDPEDILRVILYDVKVEQTLKGDAVGNVQIWYEGADYVGPDAEGPDDTHSGELRVGERYLFFAGFDPETKEYPVNATIGVIPIGNARQAANLVATFTPLIRQAERQSRQPATVDPCEYPTESPTITVEPQQGAVGDEVRLTGGPFLRLEVIVQWDALRGERLAVPRVGADCSIDLTVTIPKADPGEHRIIVQDAGFNQAETIFEVVKE